MTVKLQSEMKDLNPTCYVFFIILTKIVQRIFVESLIVLEECALVFRQFDLADQCDYCTMIYRVLDQRGNSQAKT